MDQTSFKNRIVLLGVGHTNAFIVRQWSMGNAISNTELVCVSEFPIATYSGMLPGVVAGDFERSAMEIDLVRLCQKSNCRLIVDRPIRIDFDQRQIHWNRRPPLDFDWLSIGIGSVPSYSGTNLVDPSRVVPIKPMQTFLDRFVAGIHRVHEGTGSRRPLQIAVVGGGVASTEIATCLQARFDGRRSPNQPLDQALANFSELKIQIICADPQIGRGLTTGTRRRLEACVAKRRIQVVASAKVIEVAGSSLQLSSGQALHADLILWATGAVGSEFLAGLELAQDERGFLLTHSNLSSISNPRVFAVGDSGTIEGNETAKAGVYAVRQGPILFRNLERSVAGEPLVNYLPQSDFLKLINVGHREAVAEYGGLSFRGRAPWKLKTRIDTRFMTMYQDYSLMRGQREFRPLTDMRCLGCGGKVASEVLSGWIQQTRQTSSSNRDSASHVVLGIDAPDDAAVLRFGNQEVAITTDYFAAPCNDPYLFGKLLAVHALSDLFAMGARPTAALANVELPIGHPLGQSRTMNELMAGIHEILVAQTAELVGGHTIEGPRLAAGLTVVGTLNTSFARKQTVHEGDAIVLTKHLGTGIALAGLMRCELKGSDYLRLQETLASGNEVALELLERFPIHALTDVTGFGLAGHLREMLADGDWATSLTIDNVPCWDFALELASQGIASTLAPSNQAAAMAFGLGGKTCHSKTPLLFDPQTCGGLLFTLDPEQVPAVLEFLQSTGCSSATTIGRVRRDIPGTPRLNLI